MKYKITSHRNLDSLEFELLEELPKLRVLNSLVLEDETEKKKEFFDNLDDRLKKVVNIDTVFEVLYKREDGTICVNQQYMSSFFFIKDYSDTKEGEIYFYYKDNSYGSGEGVNIIKVNEELIDDRKSEEFFKRMDEWVDEGKADKWGRNIRRYNKDLVDVGEIEGGEINFEVITKSFEKHKTEKEAEEKEMELRAKGKAEEEEVKENQEETRYNSKGEGSFNMFSVVGKIIKYDNYEYVLEKNINEIFSYSNIKDSSSSWGNTILPEIENFLNNKKTNYIKKKSNKDIYKVKYEKDKCKINDVKIPSVKIRFVLNRICYKGATKDEIKILVKLNGMKADFVSLEDLELRGNNSMKIPIVNKAIDDKTFEIEFLGKRKVFDWDKIKDFFYSGGSSRTLDNWFSNSRLLRITKDMGASKKELFTALKRIKMLNSLDKED